MKKLIKLKLIFIILILFITYNKSLSQISGVVLNVKNSPIEFANVVLYKSNGTFLVGTTTNREGKFVLKIDKKYPQMYLETSFIGYKDKKLIISNNKHNFKIHLEEDLTLLEEVVVKGKAKPIRIRGGAVVANVAGSILSKEDNTIEMLRKIPGMMLKDDKLSSFFGGKTLIYINGRKVNSIDEVKALEVKNIKKVKFNTNPGAEFDASVGSVLMISTKKRLEGLSLQIESKASIKRSKKLSNIDAIKINYNTKGLNLFGSYRYKNSNMKTYQDIETKIKTKDTLWQQNTDLYGDNLNVKYHSYSLGADYRISDSQNIGVKYDGTNNDVDISTIQNMEIIANSKKQDFIEGKSDSGDRAYSNHINSYYNNQISEDLKFEFYADYMKSHKERNQFTKEKYGINKLKETQSNNISNFDLFAISPKFRYRISEQQNLSAGIEYSYVSGNTDLDYSTSILGDKKSKTKERKLAAFINYNLSIGKFNLSSGLRYENVDSDFKDIVDRKKDINKTYGNFFPSLSLSYSNGSLSNSFTYRSGIRRPDFGKISSYSYYLNRFLYQEGNPKLISQISHNLQYSFLYKFILFQLNYVYYKDYIGNDFYTKEPNSPVLITSWKNFDKAETISALVNIHYKFGFYEPNISCTFMRNYMDFNAVDEFKMTNNPMFYVNFNNNFKLPKHFLLNIEYFFNSGGTYEFAQARSQNIFNAKIQKSFYNEKLMLSLNFKDIFNKNKNIFEGSINNISMYQINDQDRSSISLSLVWRFNNYKSVYKGRSAAKDEINRL
ncbi:TonB-dependent receptor [Marinilabiliaceae bacterium JC040]|nr:TonB-dependent receptor [Marinilabiliaceae bacterium JC040]